ncbi:MULTISPECIES: TonB-dependent receptor domain-containing protein [Steroidobacteraceae]|nr:MULTISPECIES: TonB-dependent receptor [Steroidobacteraceae]
MRSGPAQNFIGILFAALFLCGRCANGAESEPALDPDELVEWDLPRMRFYDFAQWFSRKYDIQVAVDTGNAYVGPMKGLMSPKELWTRFAEAACGTLKIHESGITYSVYPREIPPLNDRLFKYRIPRDKFANVIRNLSRQSNGLTIAYLSTSKEEEDTLVGPYNGRWSTLEALTKILAEKPELTFRWVDQEMISIEPKANVPPEQDLVARDLAGDICRATIPPSSSRMLVTASRWPSFADITSPTILDRRDIEEGGKDTLPEVLQQLSQTAFHRPLGYRATGAQFAELRGLGAQYVKVLINGRPTFASAGDFWEGAFDLNSVPLSAVERIEVSPHAASLVHGADAIGGMVNIVLREADRQIANVRYEGAEGGAGVTRGSVSAGIKTDDALASLVLDYSKTTSLLGSERSRWANQDFTRFGSVDNRSLFSTPPNVSTLDGSNLPGMSSPFAAVSISNAGVPEFRAGEVNRTSLLAWQAIVPEIRRISVSAIGEQNIGSSTFRTEFLLSDKSTSFQYSPEVIPQLVLGQDHPQNVFGIPVAVSGALSGLPSPTQGIESQLRRGVVQLTGDIADWTYETYVTHSTERAATTWTNAVDPFLLIEALSGRTSTLNVLSASPGKGNSNILAPEQTSRYEHGGTQATARLRRQLIDLPAVSATLDVGVDVKREFAEYANLTSDLARNVMSEFAIADLALLGELKTSFGVRRDDYENLSPVTSYQYSTTWQPIRNVKVRASYNDAFFAPLFIDLFFPRVALPTEIFDPARQEIASTTIVTGGNPDLRPSVGRSFSIGFEFEDRGGLRASIDFWRMTLRDRVSVVPPWTLLANSAALPDRVVRDSPTAEDIATNRPGRLLSLDMTRANFGETDTRGIDASVESELRTSVGSFRPRLDVTYTDRFRFTDLPGSNVPARERAGIASEHGTIMQWRLRGSLAYEHRQWKANILARRDSCYEDFNTTMGRFTGRSVCPALAIDLNVSRKVGEHVDVMVGGSDLLNRSPPFSEINGPVGFDFSQGDLVGRTLYLSVSGTL